jgi:hypothetical protein
LADRWEQDPYIVVSQPNTDIPVYQFLNFLSSGSFGRYRWSLKQFSRSRCWYTPDVEPVYNDSTITDEPLVQQTDERLNADDEDAHPSTDTVDSADEDESAGSASQQMTCL